MVLVRITYFLFFNYYPILGHEACFLIFLFCLYETKLLNSPRDDQAVVLRVFHKYFFGRQFCKNDLCF